MNMKRTWLAAGLLVASITAHAESGTVVRATQLLAAPFTDAANRGVLRGNQTVDIVERRGGWYHVKAANGQTGWLRLSSLRLGEAAAAEDDGGFWASVFAFTGRSQARTASATTGIRGLSEEAIHAAEPDAAAVERLAGFAPDAPALQRFAAEIGLQARAVKPLPKDAPEQAEASR